MNDNLHFNLNDINTAKIKTILFKMREVVQCPICRSEMNSVQRLPCNHHYCAECLSRVLENSRKKKQNLADCPLCKQTFSKRAIRQDSDFNEIVQSFHDLAACFEYKTSSEILSQRPNFY